MASESLPGAEERYRQLVLKLEEMQAIERALERQVLRGWRRRLSKSALSAGVSHFAAASSISHIDFRDE